MLRSFGVADLDNAPGFQSGRFDASGFSVLHDFALHGQRQGNLVIFYRENPDQHKLRWRYEGTLDANSNVISGRYALATSLDDTLDRFIIPHDNYIGNFAVVQRPLHHFETLSSVQDLSASGNRSPKDLWRIAYDAVVQAVRAQAHHVPWILFQKRRVRRRRFLELFIRYEQSAHIGNISAAEALSAEEYRELAQLENTSVISDLRFYRSLARLLIRSQVKHTAYANQFHPERLELTSMCVIIVPIVTDVTKTSEIPVSYVSLAGRPTLKLRSIVSISVHSVFTLTSYEKRTEKTTSPRMCCCNYAYRRQLAVFAR